MGYRVGELAGPYEVLQLLGRGTFGEVMLARDVRRKQNHVALKTVSCDQLCGDAAGRVQEAALTEAKILMSLKHPHIVRCFEAQWNAERYVVWLALEYMDGGDVQNLIDSRRQAEEQPFEAHFVRRVLACVGSALQYVHAEGVLHRDVKPANVLVARRSQRIKLGDFGISKLLETTGRARSVVGTPYYLAPEIVSGQAYGAPADAWALGVCLFELAALRRPFEAGNPLALVRRICEEPPVGLPEDTVPDISRAITGLLERDVHHRLTLTQALAVSDAVAALAAATHSVDHDISRQMSQVTSPSRRLGGSYLGDFSPDLPDTISQDVSPVSMATTASEYGNSPHEAGGAADIVASLCGLTNTEQIDHSSAHPWHGYEVLAQAKAALGADIDDPEDLQCALRALEAVAPQVGDPFHEAVEALSCELRIRISALRADAAALLQNLLEGPSVQGVHAALLRERTVFNLPSQWVPVAGHASVVAETVTTVCMGISDEDDADADVAALETAIELATSLGVDTSRAEERAAAVRGLLTLRVSWGAVTCFLLLPQSAPFHALVSAVARRFGIQAAVGLPGGQLPFELWYREGAEFAPLCDHSSWETCLRRHSRPGRLELRLEAVNGVAPPLRRRVRQSSVGSSQVPFVVTGRRLGSSGEVVSGSPPRVAAPPASWTGRPEKGRNRLRPPLPVSRSGRRRDKACHSGGLAVAGRYPGVPELAVADARTAYIVPPPPPPPPPPPTSEPNISKRISSKSSVSASQLGGARTPRRSARAAVATVSTPLSSARRHLGGFIGAPRIYCSLAS